ncbi:hypothetical protein ACFL4T_00030 [candidate division KSB1 bacterium]
MLKKFAALFLIVIISCVIFGDEDNPITVRSIKGKAFVRHGVSENWIELKNGDLLKKEDTIVSNANSKVILNLEGRKVFILNQEVYLDIADIRNVPENIILMMMTREELNRIPRSKNKNVTKGNVSVIHGRMIPGLSDEAGNEETLLKYKINGISSLIENGFESSAVIKYGELEEKIAGNLDYIPVSLKVAEILTDKKFLGNAKRIYKTISDKFPESPYAGTSADLLKKLRDR